MEGLDAPGVDSDLTGLAAVAEAEPPPSDEGQATATETPQPDQAESTDAVEADDPRLRFEIDPDLGIDPEVGERLKQTPSFQQWLEKEKLDTKARVGRVAKELAQKQEEVKLEYAAALSGAVALFRTADDDERKQIESQITPWFKRQAAEEILKVVGEQVVRFDGSVDEVRQVHPLLQKNPVDAIKKLADLAFERGKEAAKDDARKSTAREAKVYLERMAGKKAAGEIAKGTPVATGGGGAVTQSDQAILDGPDPRTPAEWAAYNAARKRVYGV